MNTIKVTMGSGYWWDADRSKLHPIKMEENCRGGYNLVKDEDGNYYEAEPGALKIREMNWKVRGRRVGAQHEEDLNAVEHLKKGETVAYYGVKDPEPTIKRLRALGVEVTAVPMTRVGKRLALDRPLFKDVSVGYHFVPKNVEEES